MESNDPHNLERFIKAQENAYDCALSELQRGAKRSHWIWYIFPQLTGLGRSSTAEKYGIHSLDEGRAYMAHPVLGSRMVECCRAILAVEGKSASAIMGYPDDLKLRSSMTLFSLVDDKLPEFLAVLEKYYDGEADERTIQLIENQS